MIPSVTSPLPWRNRGYLTLASGCSSRVPPPRSGTDPHPLLQIQNPPRGRQGVADLANAAPLQWHPFNLLKRSSTVLMRTGGRDLRLTIGPAIQLRQNRAKGRFGFIKGQPQAHDHQFCLGHHHHILTGISPRMKCRNGKSGKGRLISSCPTV